MNYDKVKIGLLLGFPVLAPPIAQYQFNVSAHLVLADIIVAYLPLWFKLRNNGKDTNK